MQAPESFVRSLQTQFAGKFRVRWSHNRQRWQIEQRIASDVSTPLPPITGDAASLFDDDAIRFHDGYHYFCEVAPGTLTPCRQMVQDEVFRYECKQDLKIPFMRKFGVLTCPACEANHTVAHWPLDDSLLEHIRSTDPERNPELRTKRNSRYEAGRAKATQRAGFRDELANMGRDDARRDIAKVGYTGREQTQSEPESRVRFHKVYK
jgi:hypothetical protein